MGLFSFAKMATSGSIAWRNAFAITLALLWCGVNSLPVIDQWAEGAVVNPAQQETPGRCATCDLVPCGFCQEGCLPSSCTTKYDVIKNGKLSRNTCSDGNRGEVPPNCRPGSPTPPPIAAPTSTPTLEPIQPPTSNLAPVPTNWYVQGESGYDDNRIAKSPPRVAGSLNTMYTYYPHAI